LEVADFEIVCVTKAGTSPHQHIVSVGVGSAYNKETVGQVRFAIGQGHRYYTVSPSTGKQADVRPFDCACGIKTIRSHPDAVTDNNLDNLQKCPI
jgi:hypothetical protein